MFDTYKGRGFLYVKVQIVDRIRHSSPFDYVESLQDFFSPKKRF